MANPPKSSEPKSSEPKGKTWPWVIGVAVAAGLVRLAVRSPSTPDPAVDADQLARRLASASALRAQQRPSADDGGTDAERTAFGEEMARAAGVAVPALTARFVAERFVVEWESGALRGEYLLERSYAEYRKLPASERAAFVQRRAATLTGPKLPATYAEAQTKLVPIVRERISYEVARIMASPQPHVTLRAEPPHVALTDDLWAVLAYETDEQLVRIESETLRDWNVSFDEVWPPAMKRLDERSHAATTYVVDGVRELRFGDGNDSARVLVAPALGKQRLPGTALVAMPSEALFLVATGDDDASLDALATRLLAEWDRGNQNGRVLRVAEDGKVTPFGLDAANERHARLLDLRRSTEQREERLQREALRKRLGDGEDAPFVASLFRVRNKDSGEELSFVVHSEEVTSLLPRADYVVWKRVDMTNHTATTLGCAPWSKAYPLMKPRWKETPLQPARWLASTLPTDNELKRLGCDQPMLRGEDRTGKHAP